MNEKIHEFRRGMRAKSIRKNLRNKFDEFVASIEDVALREKVQKNSIITGGAIASMLLGERVNDYDIYFTDLETTAAVARYYVDRFIRKDENGIPCDIRVVKEGGRVSIMVKSAGVASEDGTELPYQYFEGRPDDEAGEYVGEVLGDPGEIEEAYQETEEMALAVEEEGKSYRPVFMSTNAITLSNRIQLVLRFYGAADEIHENYDFIHCTNYWTSKDGHLELRPEAMESLLSRELRYVVSKYPVCSVIRLRKFIQRGWVINAGQILKMLFQISELDLSNPDILQDQLTGVDAAYFVQLMAKIKENDPEKVNAAYLVEIIDRMF